MAKKINIMQRFACAWIKNTKLNHWWCNHFLYVQLSCVETLKTVIRWLSSLTKEYARFKQVYLRLKLLDVGAEDEHLKVSSAIRTQEPITSCSIYSSSAPKLLLLILLTQSIPQSTLPFVSGALTCTSHSAGCALCHYYSDTKNRAFKNIY